MKGFSLIEILVAVAVMSIGILALVALQTNAMKFNAQSRAKQDLLGVTQAELALQKNLDHSTGTPSCVAPVPSGYSCTVVRVPCELSGSALSCQASVSDPVGYHIIVKTQGPKDTQLELGALVTKPGSS